MADHEKYAPQLPEAVRRQNERIAEMERKMKEEDAANTGNQSDEPSEVETPESVTEVQVAPEVEPVETVQPVKATGSNKDDKGLDYYKNRVDVLQGMLKAEADKRKEDQVLFNQKMTEVDKKLRELAAEKADNDLRNRKWDLAKYIPKEELEQYDEKALVAAIKVAVHASNEEMDTRIKNRVEPLERELEVSRADLAKQKYDMFLRGCQSMIPNLNVINADPEFHAWLKGRVPGTRMERQALLTQAEQQLDVDSVVEIFEAFQESRPKVEKPNLAAKVTPESLPTPAPTASKSGAAPLSRAAVSKFYNDVRRGSIKEGSKEFKEMERKIELASNAGLIY